MWIKKINDYFEAMSEYDNNNLILHVAVDLIDMLKERVTFELDDDCNMTITILWSTSAYPICLALVPQEKNEHIKPREHILI